MCDPAKYICCVTLVDILVAFYRGCGLCMNHIMYDGIAGSVPCDLSSRTNLKNENSKLRIGSWIDPNMVV